MKCYRRWWYSELNEVDQQSAKHRWCSDCTHSLVGGGNWTIFFVDIMHTCVSYQSAEVFGYQCLYVTSQHVFNVLCTGGWHWLNFILPHQYCWSQAIHADISVQTETCRHLLNLEKISSDARSLQYYTGLENADAFYYVAAHHLNYSWDTPQDISVENQFFLTLIKLCLHSPNRELSILFCIAETVVSNIFVTWINFMYVTWSKLNIWPCKELVQFYMPHGFRRLYPTTRLIVDGVEIYIKKPVKPSAQQATFSSYKNRNTLKAVVGISPGGLVSHIPDAFDRGGATVLKVGGTNSASRASRKFFLTPPLFGQWGDKILLR